MFQMKSCYIQNKHFITKISILKNENGLSIILNIFFLVIFEYKNIFSILKKKILHFEGRIKYWSTNYVSST